MTFSPMFTRSINGELFLPGSKSITLRHIVLAALADGPTTLVGCGECDDTVRMRFAMNQLGILINGDWDSLTVHGTGGRFNSGEVTLNLGQSGTSTRLIIAVCALRQAWTKLDGSSSLRARPMGALLEAIESLGACVRGEHGQLPLEIHGDISSTSYVKMRGDLSSQYFSALLQVGPLLPQGLHLEVEGTLVSKPYVKITIDEMAKYGVSVEEIGKSVFTVKPQKYTSGHHVIEGDASGASYFAALTVLHGGQMTFKNLGNQTHQGDYAFFEICEMLGAKVERYPSYTKIRANPKSLSALRDSIDFEQMPDVALTLMALAPLIPGGTRLTGLGTLRLKECDRLAAPACELRKLGVSVIEGSDFIEIGELPKNPTIPIKIETYDDHRMAMSFAILGTKVPNLDIQNPECVEKTYPRFWQELARLNGLGTRVLA
jgi:3-phosphoshikimate 1-carboxyvinyltransferase